LGKTTNKTIERKEWVPLDEVLAQLKGKLYLEPDYITLSGSGEPTLYSRIGELIVKIRQMTDIPVAVLTNGSLLWIPEVRKSLLPADLVIPSFDAGSAKLFGYVNRPHTSIMFDRILEGLARLRDEYAGQFWLEVLLLSGVTTVEAEIDRLSFSIDLIGPDKVQLNTVTRPPKEDFAEPVPRHQLEHIAQRLHDKAEVIAAYPAIEEKKSFESNVDDILNLLRRRPCSLQDIATGLGIHPNEAAKQVEQLASTGTVKTKGQYGMLYSAAVP
jgi:wyosine [tRNA(Phe)-imidazoG37] synthetase (radical SAM superfamily)